MKRLFLAFFLLVNVAPLFADEAADGTIIPGYQELVREGYGPLHHDRDDDRNGYFLQLGEGYTAAPKPTQAYYGKGYTIYYGYTAVLVPEGQASTVYAFGYPLDYFRRLMPGSAEGVDLSRYTAEVRNRLYGAGEAVAQNQSHRGNAVTTVQKVSATRMASSNGGNALPAIGEKTAQ